jgi:hypothetical protein
VKSWIDSEVASHGGAGSGGGGGADAGTSGADAGGQGGGTVDAGGGSGTDAGSANTCASPIMVSNTYQTPYALGASACGALETSSDQDWFSFHLSSGATYDLRVTTTADANVLLWRVTNRGYAQVENTSPTEIAHTSSGGSYVAVVYSPTGEVQSYTLTR